VIPTVTRLSLVASGVKKLGSRNLPFSDQQLHMFNREDYGVHNVNSASKISNKMQCSSPNLVFWKQIFDQNEIFQQVKISGEELLSPMLPCHDTTVCH